jgi:hypothetical protein
MCSGVDKLSLFSSLGLKEKFEMLNDTHKKVFWSFIHKMFIVTQERRDKKTKMFVEKSEEILKSFDKEHKSVTSSSRNIFEKMSGSGSFQKLLGEVQKEVTESGVKLDPDTMDISSLLSGKGESGKLFSNIVNNVMEKTQNGEIDISELLANMKNIL